MELMNPYVSPEMSEVLVAAAVMQLTEKSNISNALGAMIAISIGIDLFEESIDQISSGAGVPIEELTEMIREARQASNQNAPIVPNQHIISKTLLQEFCVKDSGTWRMHQYSFEHGLNSRLVSPSNVASIKNFVKIDSRETELLWSRAESNFPLALEQMKQGTILSHPESTKLIRDMMALHFARSIDALQTHLNVWRSGIGEVPALTVRPA